MNYKVKYKALKKGTWDVHCDAGVKEIDVIGDGKKPLRAALKKWVKDYYEDGWTIEFLEITRIEKINPASILSKEGQQSIINLIERKKVKSCERKLA